MSAPERGDHPLTYSLTYQDVVEILRLVNESSHCRSFELELGELKLSATRSFAAAAPLAQAPEPSASVAPASPAVPQEQGSKVPENASALVAVRAPMLGVFYRAQAPGEPAYVEPGDVVAADQTIGLIDVMKLFTPILAGVAGRVIEVAAQNASLVEYDQPLIWIDPL